MAKNLLFVLLFSSFGITSTPVFASFNSVSPNTLGIPSDECSAPAPDSFRVTSIGDHFVALAWKPAWIGASHTLSVSKKDASGAWILQYTLQDVPDSTIVIDSLESEKAYRFGIATKCPNGDPSTIVSYLSPIIPIVELTLLGRTPGNPTTVKCEGIQYKKHAWIGFKVSHGEESGLFEVVVNENAALLAYINRVGFGPESEIVASNSNGFYPNDAFPNVINVPIPFQIRDLGSPEPLVGAITLTVNYGASPSIDLCEASPIKDGYTFTPLTAEIVIDYSPDGGRPAKSTILKGQTNCYEVQNPFTENLNVFLSEKCTENAGATFSLLNATGKLIFSQRIANPNSTISFPTADISPGLYVLQIESPLGLQFKKVIKI